MSANSQSKQTHSSQLWQGFGAIAADSIGPGPTNNISSVLGSDVSVSHNNNYVNFNQFIMQHNLHGGTERVAGGGFVGPNANITLTSNRGGVDSALPRNSTMRDNNNIGMRNGFCDFDTASTSSKTPELDNFQQSNFFNPNSNSFQNINTGATSSNLYTGGPKNYNNTTTPYYDNVYTPFGNSGNDTTYFANPFATGFDFSASNLQASAPEFVPRFNHLSLNENHQPNNLVNGINSTTPITEHLKREFNKQNRNTRTVEAINCITSTDTDKLTTGFADQSSDFLQSKKTYESRGKEGNNASPYETKNIKMIANSSSGQPKNNETASSSSSSPSASSSSVVARSTGATSKNLLRSSDTRSASTNGFSNNNNNAPNRKILVRRAERERERDGRRYQNGRRSRTSWRGQVEKYSNDNGKDSPPPSPEKKSSPKKMYPENEKLSQREKLMRDIETRRLECLVCVEPIKAHHSVWSCHNCYHILHLQCIIKWASSSKSDDGWRCPACQNVVKDVPRDYYCFCGKVRNPPYNRQDIAHSCGEVCGRVEGCAHACTLLCHPGPCPPCQANVRRECGCGKTTKTMQCCLKEAIECDSICGKLLNCELHTCSASCHDGKCEPCSERVEQTCHCAKQNRQVACTRDSHDKHAYSCGKACGKDLECGNHKCKDCCHAGECRPCKLSPEMVTACPCGKMALLQDQRNSCMDPIPICDGVCGKTLRCGKSAHPHHCTNKCHLSNCPPCNKQTAVKCRCGHMDQLIKCRQLSTRADDARCKKRCIKKRSCGKHKCNQECCIDIDHICPLPCNYTLSCGKHKCDQPCHRGNCPPCYRSSFEELFCECGAEVIYPPVACGTKRPVCKRPCSRSHPCNHTPQHNCHSATSCPPCMMFTTKWCFGQHEQRKTIPCSQNSFSCGLACNKQLPCGRHKCIKSCHEGPCQTPAEICKQSCTKSRGSCGHNCMAPCHDCDCPETPCKIMVEVQCECGNRKQLRSCHDLAREYSRIATAQLASSMAEMQRGNYMELSEILTPVKSNKTNKTLDCNDECRLLERNRRLAIGLQIRNPDLPQKLLTKYSDSIRTFAKRDPILVKSIHDALTNLVKLAKESKQKSRSHSFPTMNREKRQLVHEMCEMFGVDSVAYDAEPNRNVVATAHKDRSWLPASSIMDVMQRESGQRRVPVPSNNAWGIKR